MVKYVHKESGKVASAVYNEKFKTFQLTFEDGTSKDVTSGTIKRWWKKVEDDDEYVAEIMQQRKDLGIECPKIDPDKVEIISEDVAGDGTPLAEVGKEIFQQAKEKAKMAKRTKAKKERASYVQDAMDFVFAWVKENGDDIFVPANGMNMRSFKVDGHMYAKFDFTCTSITIGVKSVTLPEGVRTPDRILNHMFDAVYQFKQELTSNDKELIDLLLTSARNYRVLKNNNSKKEEN